LQDAAFPGCSPVTTVPVVAIGASAGGIEALHALLPRLRRDWRVAFAIVLHRQSVEDDERLETLLNGWAGISVRKARDGMPVNAGTAVVCPADVHLVLEDSCYRLTTAPKENHSRPSIDVLFRSVAEVAGPRGVGVVLSGLLDDGSAGINALRSAGALTIAQDPMEAMHSGMPRSAIAAGAQLVATVEEIVEILAAFSVRARTPHATTSLRPFPVETLTRFTCPDCHGVLAEERNGDFINYRCRVGHTFSVQTLHAEKSNEIEEALWAAVQILDEQIDLTERAARRARANGNERVAARMETRAMRYRQRAAVVQQALPSVSDAIETSEVRDAIN
jgi:two-component system, chemotaxis family, protein-glutamate methylesterase/glutaminase